MTCFTLQHQDEFQTADLQDIEGFQAKRATEKENRKEGLEFLHVDGATSLPRLSIIRIALEPEVNLMQQVLSTAQAESDHQRFHKLMHQGHHSPTRLEHLHSWCQSDGLFQEALANSARNLCDPTLWNHLEPVEEMAFHIFTSVLRPASLQWDLVLRRCMQYPYKLFHLITHPETANDALRESIAHPCLLDPLAQAFFAKYDTVDSIQSVEASEVLKTLSLQVMGHTWTTERPSCALTNLRKKVTMCNLMMAPSVFFFSRLSHTGQRIREV